MRKDEDSHLKNRRMHICKKHIIGSTVLHSTVQPFLPSIIEAVSVFSPSTLRASSATAALDSISSVLSTTPPVAYFVCLVSAGIGVPISEDALCICAGTIFPTINAGQRKRLLFALYAGVVISDILTFSLGKLLRSGVLTPLRKRMKLTDQRINFCSENSDSKETSTDNAKFKDEELCSVETPKLKNMDKTLAKLEAAGDYVGFVIRFSCGIRTPMMLLAGFSDRVPLVKYVTGTLVGAFFSLSLQLIIGYAMRNNPAAILAALATISTSVILLPLGIAFFSWASLLWKKRQFRKII